MVFFSPEPACLQSGRHISLLWMPEGQKPGAETLGPWTGSAKQRVCPTHGRHEEQLKEHTSSAVPALPVVGWGLQCRRHFCSVESLEHHLQIIRSSLNAFAEVLWSMHPHFHCCSLKPNNGNVSTQEHLLPSFPLEQVFLGSDLQWKEGRKK